MSSKDIEVGDVIYLYNEIANKYKYSICISVSKEYFFIINTEYRSFYESIKIERTDNIFLKYDSYVECSRVFIYNTQEILSAERKGKVSDKVLVMILKKVQNSARLPNIQKSIIIQELKKALNI